MISRAPRRLVVGAIRGYQLVVSPWFPPSCKFYPSCSAYAVTAVQRHGVLRGGWLALRRLARCHPWALGGVDDVPGVQRTGMAGTDAERPSMIGDAAVRRAEKGITAHGVV